MIEVIIVVIAIFTLRNCICEGIQLIITAVHLIKLHKMIKR